MANQDIINTIISDVTPTGNKTKVTYSCNSGVELMWPVTGEIVKAENNSVTIKPNSGTGLFTIEEIDWETSAPAEHTRVTRGSSLGAKTKQMTVTLTSTVQDLTVLLPCYNKVDSIIEVLDNLSNLLNSQSIPFKIIVVDKGEFF